MSGNRLDIALAKITGLSRTASQELITSGDVCVNGITTLKPGIQVCPKDRIDYRLPQVSFVSRGGHKLRAALEAFNIDLTGQICLDIGSSTGGFTHCMLTHGAALVYALDVGTAQLHPQLRLDTRVVSMENTNILNIMPHTFCLPPVFAALDVSFVSVTKILPHVATFPELKNIVVLIKPQFECGKAALNKRGIVKDEKSRKQAISAVTAAAVAADLCLVGLQESPLQGGDGNVEYLAHFISTTSQIAI